MTMNERPPSFAELSTWRYSPALGPAPIILFTFRVENNREPGLDSIKSARQIQIFLPIASNSRECVSISYKARGDGHRGPIRVISGISPGACG